MGTVHVVGAGLAGLAAAVRAAQAGRRVVVYESAPQAGGRCRSLFDDVLGRTIDNGNHLILSGNTAVAAYLAAIGAGDVLVGPERADYPFLDLQTGERWTLRPGVGRIPWWVLCPRRRIPGTALVDYIAGLKLAWVRPTATIADCFDRKSILFRRFWEPMAVAVLNAQPEEAAAALLWPVLWETFGRGEVACRPRLARQGLGPALVEPALAFLKRCGAQVSFNARLRSLMFEGDRVAALDLGREAVALAAADSLVLAVPPGPAAALVPDLIVPRESRAILNGHFLLEGGGRPPAMLGVVGGLTHWIFVRDDIASVTVSAADAVIDEPAEVLAGRLWGEVRRALELGERPLPAYRILKEKRATFAQTPVDVARRPGTRTTWKNLFLAGDWTDTGLPATIEGALRSGGKAAEAAIGPYITKS